MWDFFQNSRLTSLRPSVKVTSPLAAGYFRAREHSEKLTVQYTGFPNAGNTCMVVVVPEKRRNLGSSYPMILSTSFYGGLNKRNFVSSEERTHIEGLLLVVQSCDTFAEHYW